MTAPFPDESPIGPSKRQWTWERPSRPGFVVTKLDFRRRFGFPHAQRVRHSIPVGTTTPQMPQKDDRTPA
jgi:hypothetical protein